MKRLVCTLASLFIITHASAKTGDEANVPAPQISNFVTVTIGNIPGLMDRAGRLASKVASMDPAQLKAQVGAMLGDPKLEGLPDGSGFVAIVPREGKPFAFIEIAESKTAQYEKLLQSRGTVARAVPGGIVLAQTEQDLTAATANAPALKTLLAGSGSPSISVRIQLSALMDHYKDQIQGGMEKLRATADKSGGTNADAAGSEVFQKIMTMYYNMGRAIDTVEVRFDISDRGLQIDKTVVPLKKSASPPSPSGKGPTADVLSQYLQGTGAIRCEVTDMAPLMDFSFKFIDLLAAETTDTKVAAGMKDIAAKAREVFSGAAAMDYFSGESKDLSGGYVLSVSNPEKAIQFLEEITKSPNSILTMYESMGMKMDMTFEKNVRQHAGVQVHRQTMKMDLSKMGIPAGQMEFMRNMTAELAVQDNKMFYAMGSTKVDDMLDAAKSGTKTATPPLLSRKSFPPGGIFYLDYNFGRLMKLSPMMSETTGALAMSKFADTLAAAPPLQIAGYFQEGTYKFSMLLSAEMIKSVADSVMSMSAQKRSAPGAGEKPSNVE